MGNGERVFLALFGALLLGVGIYALLDGEADAVWRYLGGLSFAALGANAIHGAVIGRRPWIARIGPLS